MCYGIQVYGLRQEMVGAIKCAQRHGFSFTDTVKDIMTEFRLEEQEAKEIVEKNWNRTSVDVSEKKE